MAQAEARAAQQKAQQAKELADKEAAFRAKAREEAAAQKVRFFCVRT